MLILKTVRRNPIQIESLVPYEIESRQPIPQANMLYEGDKLTIKAMRDFEITLDGDLLVIRGI